MRREIGPTEGPQEPAKLHVLSHLLVMLMPGLEDPGGNLGLHSLATVLPVAVIDQSPSNRQLISCSRQIAFSIDWKPSGRSEDGGSAFYRNIARCRK
jgi:hypothetical protein